MYEINININISFELNVLEVLEEVEVHVLLNIIKLAVCLALSVLSLLSMELFWGKFWSYSTK
jgi:hypothetical protein